MGERRTGVTVVIPTYNERENVGLLLPRLARVLSEHGYDYEILVVDDDSPDGTCEAVREVASRLGDSRIRCVSRRGERDLSTAVIEGMRRARHDIVVVMDADLQHPPETVPRLVEKILEGYDVAVASRYAPGGGVRDWSRIRLYMSRIGTVIARLLVPSTRKTSDPLSGFFAVRKSRIDLDSLQARGFKILVEILGRSNCVRVVDVPYIFEKRIHGSSKLGFQVGKEFLRQAWRLSPMPKFMLVGASGAVVNLVVMWLVLKYLAIVDAASIAGIEASIVWNFLFHEFFTFGTRLGRECGSGPFRRLILYHKASILGIAATYAIMRLLTLLGVPPLAGQAAGIIAGFILNYRFSTVEVWNCSGGCRGRESGGVQEARRGDRGVH